MGFGTGDAVSQEIARRIEQSPPEQTPQQFINAKAGTHPFRTLPRAWRPHVILITLDMVSPDHYHPSRTLHRAMNLPAIQSFVENSVFFSNAFCVSPLCAPARAALATGRYSYITANGERAHDGHETMLRPADVIFQEYLKATGYRTKHAGKGHLGTAKYVDAFNENATAWDRWALPIYDDELYLAYLKKLGVSPPRYKTEIFGLAQDRATKETSLGGWIEQANGAPFPFEAQYTNYLVERAIDKLDAALAESDEGHPVYLQIDIFDPHQPFSIPAGFEQRAEALRGVCGSLPDSYERARARNWSPAADEPKIYNFYQKAWGLYDPQILRDYRLANALQMEVVDRALLRLIGALKDHRIYDEALIVFTCDHGEMNGRRAVVDKGVYLFPDVIRVPLAIKLPSRFKATSRTIAAPVSHLDLAPTLLDVVGIEPSERLDGQSLLPYLTGTSEPGDRDFIFECGWHTGVNFACGIQHWSPAAHYLYSYNLSSTIDELYDLRDEDAENLASRRAYAKLHQEMIRRLGAVLAADARWRGYWHSFRVDHYAELPKTVDADKQMFRPK